MKHIHTDKDWNKHVTEHSPDADYLMKYYLWWYFIEPLKIHKEFILHSKYAVPVLDIQAKSVKRIPVEYLQDLDLSSYDPDEPVR